MQLYHQINLFSQEASRLEPGEQLQSCPRCTSPARVKPDEGWAHCCRLSCQYSFCIRCQCDHHPKGTKCKTSSRLPRFSKKSSKTEMIFPEIAVKKELSNSSIDGTSSTSSVGGQEHKNKQHQSESSSSILPTKSLCSSNSRAKVTVASKKSRIRLKRL